MTEQIRTWIPATVLLLCVLLAATLSAEGATRQAQLAFTVDTSETPWALTYSEARNEWVVLYKDTDTLRFYSPTGQLLRTRLIDLSGNLPQYTTPAVCDLIDGGWDTRCQGLLGNPNASLPPTGQPGNPYTPLLHLPRFDYNSTAVDYSSTTGLTSLADTFRISRYETLFDEQGGHHAGAEVMLDDTGQKVVLWEMEEVQPGLMTNAILSLPDLGIPQAESVTLRQWDLNPVVLHDNEISILMRHRDVYGLHPDADPGDLLDHWAIEGLPAGASLIDIDQIRPMLTTNPNGGTFYVLDQVGGGVYAMVPEPTTCILLAGGLVALLRRRQRQR